jgi:hypothetical protein
MSLRLTPLEYLFAHRKRARNPRPFMAERNSRSLFLHPFYQESFQHAL